jgi:hypothetical protein
MWRAFFLAVGITLAVLGAECLLIDSAVFVMPSGLGAAAAEGSIAAGSHNIAPPDWAPWSLLSAGAVVMLYSFTIPRRVTSS